jgi:RNA polymerase sigma-70 factor (ECF subfamily)
MSTQEMHDGEFSALMQRVRDGSEEAFQELLDKYGHHVFRVVRARLDMTLRSKFDSVDFVQSVWACLLKNRERLSEFGAAQDLIQFLVKVARDRVVDEYRRRVLLQGKNVTREVPLSSHRHVSPAPTASQIAIAREHLGKLLGGQSDESRRIIEMRLEGATYGEIASELGVNPKTVQRTLRILERTSFLQPVLPASQGRPQGAQ